jgi:hypothetical protein
MNFIIASEPLLAGGGIVMIEGWGDVDIQVQDTTPQKCRYLSRALDSTGPEPGERRYPLRKR